MTYDQERMESAGEIISKMLVGMAAENGTKHGSEMDTGDLIYRCNRIVGLARDIQRVRAEGAHPS